MDQFEYKQCSQCGQKLRFPKNVGGIVMSCPTCGKRFQSDFKIDKNAKTTISEVTEHKKTILQTIFELPTTLLSRLVQFIKSL